MAVLIGTGRLHPAGICEKSSRIKTGTVYPTLQRMERNGQVTSQTVSGMGQGMTRRYYEPTPLGRECYAYTRRQTNELGYRQKRRAARPRKVEQS